MDVKQYRRGIRRAMRPWSDRALPTADPEADLLQATLEIARHIEEYGDLGSPRLKRAQESIRRAIAQLTA